MKPWFKFFLGTPRRALWTVVGLGLLYGLLDPEGLGYAVHALLKVLLAATLPLMEPLMALAIMALGVWVVFRKVIFPKKKSKKK